MEMKHKHKAVRRMQPKACKISGLREGSVDPNLLTEGDVGTKRVLHMLDEFFICLRSNLLIDLKKTLTTTAADIHLC